MQIPVHLFTGWRVLALLGVILLAGCGTVQHKATLEPGYTAQADTKLEVGAVTNQTGQSFDVDVEKMLSEALVRALKDKDILGSPESAARLTLDAQIVEYTKGDAFKRWLMPGWGSTVLVVKATLVDGENKKVGTVEAKRTVDAGGGYTIGAWESIFRDVAADIVADLAEKVK